MSDVIKGLRRFDFPEVIRHALAQVEKACSSKPDVPPNTDLIDQIVDEFVFQQMSSRKNVQRRVSDLCTDSAEQEFLFHFYIQL